ncbi:MAG: nucleoid-associated protein [Bacteroidales bacterium]|nr:nucleoid-associated protein [Bacteroidales bacterium]
MTSLDLTNIEIQQLITHHIGNKLRDEKYILSSETSIVENSTREFLLKYFLLPMRPEEFYSFSHSVQLGMNEIYSLVKNTFNHPGSFISDSQSIAKLLYEQSMHPKIKEGELNIVHFSNIVLEGEIVEAIGLFKSETDVPYIKMKNLKSKFSINHDYGFEIKGMDKGCIIFNTDEQIGYKILIVDNANKSTEAQYWKDDFLKVKPISNEFHQTKQFLNITKGFVTKQLPGEFEINKADQIDILNRSVEYFKTHETFDKNDFEKEVFQDNNIIASFRDFDKAYRENNDIKLSESFGISSQAVKKQARVFKSVLKLDKNFHIYIHGNRELIKRGIENDGRKYYKIYYDKEE